MMPLARGNSSSDRRDTKQSDQQSFWHDICARRKKGAKHNERFFQISGGTWSNSYKTCLMMTLVALGRNQSLGLVAGSLQNYKAEEVDNAGWVRENVYSLCCSKGQEKWLRYDLRGKNYTTLSGSLYDENQWGGSACLEFYADDGDFIGSTPRIDNKNTNANFSFDITGVDFLTVCLKSDEVGTWILADVELAK